MFQIGEYLVHPLEGVCMVNDISERGSGDFRRKYYELAPVIDQHLKIFIPILNEKDVGLRPLSSKEELCCFYQLVEQSDTPWIADTRVRFHLYHEKMISGDSMEIAKLLKMLWQRNLVKPLSGKDKDFMEEAGKRSLSELSLVFCKPYPEILEEAKNNLLSFRSVK